MIFHNRNYNIFNRNYNITPTFVFADNVMVRPWYRFYHSFSARRNCDPLLLPFRLPFLVKAADEVRQTMSWTTDSSGILSSWVIVVVLHRPSVVTFVVTSGTTSTYLSKHLRAPNFATISEMIGPIHRMELSDRALDVLYLPPPKYSTCLGWLKLNKRRRVGLANSDGEYCTICRNYASACQVTLDSDPSPN